jgi:hypothetical protein
VRIASLKPSPAAPMRCDSGHAAAVEAQPCQRVRRDDLDALGDLQPRRAGLDHEGREAARTRCFAGAGEDDVEVGDAAVGDPGLLAVQHRSAPSRVGTRAWPRHVGAGVGLGQGEGRDRLAAGHARQPARTLLAGARPG